MSLTVDLRPWLEAFLVCAALFVDALRREALTYVAEIEELAVTGGGLPYRIPRRYNA